jgi:hypothetical protein
MKRIWPKWDPIACLSTSHTFNPRRPCIVLFLTTLTTQICKTRNLWIVMAGCAGPAWNFLFLSDAPVLNTHRHVPLDCTYRRVVVSPLRSWWNSFRNYYECRNQKNFASPCYMWSQSYVDMAVISIKNLFWKTNIFTWDINQILRLNRLDPVVMQGSLKTPRRIVQRFEIILEIICVP